MAGTLDTLGVLDGATRKGDWVAKDRPPASVKTFATLSLILWICVVTAGTSDIPVAEEAVVTAKVFGNEVSRVIDEVRYAKLAASSG